DTGGFAVVNSNNVGAEFQRVVHENTRYYVVGYYQSNRHTDGRFHRIVVRVRNRPDLRVSARRGYWSRDAKQEKRERENRERLARKQAERRAEEEKRDRRMGIPHPTPLALPYGTMVTADIATTIQPTTEAVGSLKETATPILANPVETKTVILGEMMN